MDIEGVDLAAALGAQSASYVSSGSYGDTWRVSGIQGTQGDVAVKVLNPQYFDPHRAKREVEGLKRFTHRGIVELLGTRIVQLKTDSRLALIFEFIDGGSISDAIESEKYPDAQESLAFATALFEALELLHSKKTIHRDLKPDNILLREGDWSKPVLIDFGFSRTISEPTVTVYPGFIGTYYWSSPEQLQGTKARKASDLWSCGLILYYIGDGTHPFLDLANVPQMTVNDLYELFLTPHRPIPKTYPKALRKLVEKLLTPEPNYRRGTARKALADLRKNDD